MKWKSLTAREKSMSTRVRQPHPSLSPASLQITRLTRLKSYIRKPRNSKLAGTRNRGELRVTLMFHFNWKRPIAQLGRI